MVTVTGEDLKQEGMDRVYEAEPTPWKDKAWEYVRDLEPGTQINADQLCDAIGRPERPNSVGAFFYSMAVAGYLKRVDFTRSKRPIAHAGLLSVWERVIASQS